MARPQKNTVSYFPLDCDDGKKMFYIEETYGNDGYATFIKLLKELAKSEYHYLNLSKPTTIMFLSSKCKVSKEVLLNIISDLVELEKFDKELWEEDRVIWCQDFIDSIQDAYLKRKNKCIDRKSLIQLLIGLGVRKPVKQQNKQGFSNENNTNNTQSKVKDNKEEEIKENKTKSENSFDFKKHLLDEGFSENLVDDWLLIRKAKNATNTQTALNKFIREISLAPEDKNEVLEFIVGKEWKSFEYQWLVNLQNEFKQQQERNNGKTRNNKTREYSTSDDLKTKIANRLLS